MMYKHNVLPLATNLLIHVQHDLEEGKVGNKNMSFGQLSELILNINYKRVRTGNN